MSLTELLCQRIYQRNKEKKTKTKGDPVNKTNILKALSRCLIKPVPFRPNSPHFNHLNKLSVNQMYRSNDKTFEYVISLAELYYFR